MGGCGCKKRRPRPAKRVQNIKLTEGKPAEKKTISDAERNIINQIKNELKSNAAVI